MPQDAPAAKLEGTRGYGAEVVLYDRYSIAQADAGQAFQQERGLEFVSSHDDPMISAGAGTAALELMEDVESIDVLLAPIGGGGGMTGYATVVKTLLPDVRVIGVEPAASGVTRRSLAAGRRVTIDVPTTIADGQQLTTPGRYPFEAMKRLVDDIVLVEDDEIVDAIAFLFDRLKIVTEPSGAIAAAALLAGKVDVKDERVGVMITGGNIGVERFAQLLLGRAR